MLYYFYKKDYDAKSLKQLLIDHSEIQFVSLVGVDLGGNDTDEKIPIKLFLDDVECLLKKVFKQMGQVLYSLE